MDHRSPSIVLATLALTHFATILLFLAAALLFRFEPTNLYVSLVVPVGALFFGMIGALGAFPGARLAQYSPGTALRNLMMGTAAASYVLYLLVLATLANWASADHPGVFAAFVQLQTQGEFTIGRASRQLASLGRMGDWGYLLLALKFAGVVGGAAVMHESLRLLPYCASCRVFTRTREKGTLHFPSFERWAAAMQDIPAEPWLRARFMLQLPRQKALSIPGRHYVLVRLRRHECPQCLEQHMRERVFVHNGRAPVEQKQLSSAYSWLPSQARSQPKPAAQAPAVRGFGRKIA